MNGTTLLGISAGIATVVVGGIGAGIGAGVSAGTVDDPESAKGARGVARSLGVAAAITAGVVLAVLAGASLVTRNRSGTDGLFTTLIGIPLGVLTTGAGIGIGGAALGTLLVAKARD